MITHRPPRLHKMGLPFFTSLPLFHGFWLLPRAHLKPCPPNTVAIASAIGKYDVTSLLLTKVRAIICALHLRLFIRIGLTAICSLFRLQRCWSILGCQQRGEGRHGMESCASLRTTEWPSQKHQNHFIIQKRIFSYCKNRFGCFL